MQSKTMHYACFRLARITNLIKQNFNNCFPFFRSTGAFSTFTPTMLIEYKALVKQIKVPKLKQHNSCIAEKWH